MGKPIILQEIGSESLITTSQTLRGGINKNNTNKVGVDVYNTEIVEASINPLTLNAGTQIIESPKRTPLRVNRIDGKTTVNLIPPFTSRDWVKHVNATASADGRALTLNATANSQLSSLDVLVSDNKQYRISGIVTNGGGIFALYLNSSDTHISIDYVAINKTLIPPTGTVKIRFQATNGGLGAGTFTFSDLILTEGTEQHDYVQGVQHTSGVYVENETNNTYQYFARDSKGDVLRLADGEYIDGGRKWKTTEVVELTGRENWLFAQNFTGFKRVTYTIGNAVTASDTVVKYDGKVLKMNDGSYSAGDQSTIFNNVLNLTISNTDSGWGDSYTPTVDEIKAYFMGWRMFLQGSPVPALYNGTGTKAWEKIWCGIGIQTGIGGISGTSTTTLPTSMNDMGYKPYQLHYKLATPYWEEIQTEGQVVLEEGNNHVTLGSGMVVREVANFLEGPTTVSSNTIHPATMFTLFKYRVYSIFRPYENGVEFTRENLIDSDVAFAYGNERLVFRHNKTNFNPKAQYSVTYLALPYVITSGIASLQVETYENIKSVQDSHTELIVMIAKELMKNTDWIGKVSNSIMSHKADIETAHGINNYAKIAQPEWIAPTLISGWVNNSQSFSTAGYFKNTLGFVHLKGTVTGGLADNTIFNLPAGFRPVQALVFPVENNGAIRQVRILTNGNVIPIVTTSTGLVTLDGIIFRV